MILSAEAPDEEIRRSYRNVNILYKYKYKLFLVKFDNSSWQMQRWKSLWSIPCGRIGIQNTSRRWKKKDLPKNNEGSKGKNRIWKEQRKQKTGKRRTTIITTGNIWKWSTEKLQIFIWTNRRKEKPFSEDGRESEDEKEIGFVG